MHRYTGRRRHSRWTDTQMHIHRWTDRQTHKCTDTQIDAHRHTGKQTHRYTNAQTHRCTNIQIRRWTDAHTHRWTDTECTDTQMDRWPDTQVDRHKRTDTQMDRRTDTQIHRWTDTQTRRWTDTDAQTHGCTDTGCYVHRCTDTQTVGFGGAWLAVQAQMAVRSRGGGRPGCCLPALMLAPASPQSTQHPHASYQARLRRRRWQGRAVRWLWLHLCPSGPRRCGGRGDSLGQHWGQCSTGHPPPDQFLKTLAVRMWCIYIKHQGA